MGDTGGYGVDSVEESGGWVGGGFLGMSWTIWGHALWRGETSLGRPTSLIVRHSM